MCRVICLVTKAIITLDLIRRCTNLFLKQETWTGMSGKTMSSNINAEYVQLAAVNKAYCSLSYQSPYIWNM